MAAAVPSFDFVAGPSEGGALRGRRSSGIDQRQSLGALARRRREHQYRDSRKAEAMDNDAPRIWNLHHA